MATMPRRPNDDIPRTRAHEIRLLRGLSLTEAARLAETGPPTLTKIEKVGGNGISKNLAPKLAAAYEVEVPMLYAEMGSPIPPSRREVAKEISDEVSAAQSPGLRQITDNPKTLRLFRIWQQIPEGDHDMALRILEDIRDASLLRRA